MSEIATELSGATEPIASVEFLGRGFAERKQALLRVEAFKRLAEQALADSVLIHVDQEVCMTFQPSSVAHREYKFSFPCYSIRDDKREPITKQVTVRDVDSAKLAAIVSTGELVDGRYDAVWSVSLRNIIEITPLATTTEPQLSSAQTEQQAILDSAAYWGLDHGSLPNGRP